MNIRTGLLLLLLLPFSLLSAYAMVSVGYWGIFEAALAGPGAWQLFADLVIACLLICGWMLADCKDKGFSAWPFIALTFVAGSFGPLLYLLRREWNADPGLDSESAARL